MEVNDKMTSLFQTLTSSSLSSTILGISRAKAIA